MAQTFIHRFGWFDLDGICRGRGVWIWQGDPSKRLPGKWSTGTYPVLYARPMDDDLDHWHRLCGEVWALDHPDLDIRAQAGDHKLRHEGGAVHPQYAHLMLGGTLTWTADSHPAVHEHAAWLAGLSHHDFVEHFVGQNMFEVIA